jgi:hypothetical protein
VIEKDKPLFCLYLYFQFYLSQEGLVNQGANLPKSVQTTGYVIMAATAILLLVTSVPIIHPAAAQSDGSTFGQRHTTLCGVGPAILDGTGHPFLSIGLQAICSGS